MATTRSYRRRPLNLFLIFFSIVVSAQIIHFFIKNLRALFSVYSVGRHTSSSYLYYGSKIDGNSVKCYNVYQQTDSLRCAFIEANFSKRTFVLPREMCISRYLNPVSDLGLKSEGKSTRLAIGAIFDVEAINQSLSGGLVLSSSAEWLTAWKSGKGDIVKIENKASMLEAVKLSIGVQILHRKNKATWRSFCSSRWIHSQGGVAQGNIPYAKSIVAAANEIAFKLGEFDLLQVRKRGKLDLNKVGRTKYPHLSGSTHPTYILKKLLEWTTVGRTIYISTDDPSDDYRSVIGEWFNVKMAGDFKEIIRQKATNFYQVLAIEDSLVPFARNHFGTFRGQSQDNYFLCRDPVEGLRRAVPRSFRI